MNPAAATEHGAPETAGSNRGERGLGRDSSGRRAPAASRWRPRPRFAPHLLALGGLLALSLGLRLWGIKQGLPYSYNTDEATHFVAKALAFSGGDLNPHYFLNPPAYTYL